jgi:hypothetical protein
MAPPQLRSLSESELLKISHIQLDGVSFGRHFMGEDVARMDRSEWSKNLLQNVMGPVMEGNRFDDRRRQAPNSQ